jgi:N-dimethylarginine dimethylaminohydrolase
MNPTPQGVVRAPFGCRSMVAPIRRLLLKHARDAFGDQPACVIRWTGHGFLECPDYDGAVREYDAFASLLAEHIPDIGYLPAGSDTNLDSIYVHDPVIVTDRGAILGRMGKPAREREPDEIEAYLSRIELPVAGRIEPPGLLEGGDVLWIDERAVAIGEGYRTNAEGIRQFRALVGDEVEVVPVGLPGWHGPESCLHLMSMISLIDDDLAVVYSRLMPVPFRRWLMDRGIRLVEVAEEEFHTLGCNVLAIAPRLCVMMDDNPRTRQHLEREGATVLVFSGREICLKGEGGPTCLTRPLLRA